MQADFDVGVAFIIFQANVITRAVLLDQVHLKDERFQLRPDHDPFNVGDIGYQLAGFKIRLM